MLFMMCLSEYSRRVLDAERERERLYIAEQNTAAKKIFKCFSHTEHVSDPGDKLLL